MLLESSCRLSGCTTSFFFGMQTDKHIKNNPLDDFQFYFYRHFLYSIHRASHEDSIVFIFSLQSQNKANRTFITRSKELSALEPSPGLLGFPVRSQSGKNGKHTCGPVYKLPYIPISFGLYRDKCAKWLWRVLFFPASCFFYHSWDELLENIHICLLIK